MTELELLQIIRDEAWYGGDDRDTHVCISEETFQYVMLLTMPTVELDEFVPGLVTG